MFNSSSLWSLIPELKIQMIIWEDDVVIFNRLTQDTHLLNQPAEWILSILKNKVLSFDELIGLAITEDIITNDEDSFMALKNFLTCLREIDLIELRSNQCEDNPLA